MMKSSDELKDKAEALQAEVENYANARRVLNSKHKIINPASAGFFNTVN